MNSAMTWLSGLFSRNGHTSRTKKARKQAVGARGEPRSAATVQSVARVPRANSWVTLATEIEKDAPFALGSGVIKALIQTTEIAIEANQDDPRAQALVDNLTDRWYDALPHALSAFGWGFAPFEFWYRYNSSAGIIEVDEIRPLPASHVRPHVPPGTNDIQGIELVTDNNAVIRDGFWWLAIDQYADPRGWSPWGNSKYSRGAYDVWRHRQELAHQRRIYVKRYANGQLVGYAPSQAIEGRAISQAGDIGQVDDAGQPIDPKRDMADAIIQTESGGIAVFDSRNYPAEEGGGPLYRVESMPVGMNPAPIDGEETRTREDALAVIGVPPRAVMQDMAAGSFASVNAYIRVLFCTVGAFLDQIVTSFQRAIIDPTVRLNWPEGMRPTFRLTYQKMDLELQALIVEIVKTIVTSGQVSAIVTEGVIDFGKLLDIAGIPKGDELPQRLAALKQAAQQQAAPSQSFGMSLTRRLANEPPESIPIDWEDIAERANREAASILPKIYRLLAEEIETDEDGRVRTLTPDTRRRL